MKKASGLRNKTIIVGCGRLGSSIATRDSSAGKNVIVIDKDSNHFDALSEKFSGYTSQGDATDPKVLTDNYIETAKEIIIVTDSDTTNVLVAHIARTVFDVPNIYVRLSDPSLEVLLKGMNINTIFPFELSIDKFTLMRGGKKK